MLLFGSYLMLVMCRGQSIAVELFFTCYVDTRCVVGQCLCVHAYTDMDGLVIKIEFYAGIVHNKLFS